MFRADVSQFPFVFQLWQGEVTMADVEPFLAHMKWVLERVTPEKQHYATIAVGSTNMPPDVRKAVSDWANGLSPETVELNVGSYVVSQSTLVRGVITALKWTSKSMKYVHSVRDVPEAIRMARAALVKVGVNGPSEVKDPFAS